MDTVEQARRWGNAKEKGLRRKLDDLYRLRIAVDYAVASVSHPQAEFGLNVVQQTLQTIASHTDWEL
jgi:hypothetical protein